MKKILFLIALLFVIIELNAHGACLIENLKIKSTCSGGAAPIKIPENQDKENTDYKELQKMYQVPTMSLPNSYKNNFPMLNQNCTLGTCFPK